MRTDETVQVCPDDGLHRCRYCGEYFDHPYNTGFTDETGRHHYITGSAGILSGEQRYLPDGRRVRAGDKPVAEEVGEPEVDEEDEEPIVAEPTRVYPEAKNPVLSEHDRYVRFVLGPVRGPRK
ncbi:MAG: hypothetical protein WAN14_20385 [Candidatus Acidiferrales bacterium]